MITPPASMLILSHNIYLTRQERYALIEQETIDVVGVCLPVWFTIKYLTAPTEEVFCKYSISNFGPEQDIKVVGGGYQINLPQIPSDWIPAEPLTNEQWRDMSENEKRIWYKRNSTPKNAKWLADVCDGGGEQLYFRQVTSLYENKTKIKLVHFVSIKTIEILTESVI